MGRYEGCGQTTALIPDEAAEGGVREVRYLRRRLLPPRPGSVDGAAQVTGHLVVRGDRPDLLAARYLGDPERYWQLCDANLLVHPDELTGDDRVGTRIAVPLPWAPTGGPDA